MISSSTKRALQMILGLQIGIAFVLFFADFGSGWRALTQSPVMPRVDQPVSPGDQTRRYRPSEIPLGPETRPFPPPAQMPPRLLFEVLDQGETRVLRMSGEIATGDADRFTAWQENTVNIPRQVVLNSPGGSVEDALAIGRALRRDLFNTRIASGDQCLSACPYILAGGVTRKVDPDSYVGVHQHYFGENIALPAFLAVSDIQSGQGRVMGYLVEMDIDPRLMEPALLTPPDQIYILLMEELEAFNLISTDTSSP